jgi:hypothetical protein
MDYANSKKKKGKKEKKKEKLPTDSAVCEQGAAVVPAYGQCLD